MPGQARACLKYIFFQLQLSTWLNKNIYLLMSKGSDNTFLFGGLALILLMSGDKKNTAAINPASTNSIRLPFDGKLTTFVRLALPYVQEARKKYPKIPTELFLMQGALESANGKAAPGNMFFGHKAGKNYTGDKQLLRTTEILPKGSGYSFPEVISITKLPSGKYRWVVKDWFRKYPTPLGSFLDYAANLSRSHYANAFTSTDINKIIDGVAAAGYATDPNYATKLKKLLPLVRAAIQQA